VATEITELAKSLVSSRDRNAEWLRLNASTRHGLPWNEAESTERATRTETTTTRVVDQPIAGVPVEKIPSWLKNALIALAAGGGTLGAYKLLEPNTTPPVIEKPTDPTSGSLLQYLEDEGFHQP